MKPAFKIPGKYHQQTKQLNRPAIKPTSNIDPLYVIFEQHLYNFQDSDTDRKTFIATIVIDYLNHLRRMNIIVPKSLEQPIMDELAEQVNSMLVKKIYGCFNIKEYQKNLPHTAKRRAQTKYSKLNK